MALAAFNSAALTSQSGLAVSANAVISVRRESDGVLASIFSDSAGSALIAQPGFVADSLGRFKFYAAGLLGGYRITVTDAASPGLSFTLRNVPIGNLTELDNPLTTAGDLWVAGASGAPGRKALGSSDGYPLVPLAGGLAYLPPGLGYNLVGGTFIGSPAGSPNGDLLVQVKTWSGNDPSAAEPVFIPIRSATATDALPVYRKVTAALSLTIQVGSTHGATSGRAFRIWLVAFDDGGTVRLSTINCLNGSDFSIYQLAGFGIASAVIQGGSPSGLADSAHVFYANATVSSKAYAVLGYMEWGQVSGSPSEAGLLVAGNWVRSPTRHQLFGPGVLLPGTVVQAPRFDTGAVATGTTTIPIDDTPPQIAEGDQYMSLTVTPSGAANVLRTRAQGHVTNTAAPSDVVSALFQDSTADALKATNTVIPTNGYIMVHNLEDVRLAGSTSPTTMKYRAGNGSAGTTTFNGTGGVRRYGGTFNSYIQIEEVTA